jgi:4-amino-4-deoxy-L-arabinose transferase-like glycosyltransferase
MKRALPALGLTLVLVPLYGWEFLKGQPRILEELKALSPLFLAVTFIALAGLFVLSWKDLLRPFSSVPVRARVFGAALGLGTFALAFFVAPRTHRIYYDENIYMHIGQAIADTHKAEMVNFGVVENGRLVSEQGEYNKQPNAYPFLLSLVYRVTGPSENLTFLFNNVVFALTTLVLFGLGTILGGRAAPGLCAAAAFAVVPQNILWANTTSAEPANTFFLAFTVFIFLVFLRSGKPRLFFLAVVAACFTAQFRLESLLIFPLLGIMVFIDGPRPLPKAGFFYAVPLVGALLFAHVFHIFSFQGHPWGADHQDKLSIFYVRSNLRTNGLFFILNKDFPALLTAFAAVALATRKFLKEKLVLLFWFVLFWGVFLFFYAGSYYYGADIRFSLMAFPPLCLLAGLGLAAADALVRKALKVPVPVAAVVIAAAFAMFYPKAHAVGEEAWAARADHLYARTMADALPPRSIVFTHNPNMFLFWGRSAAQASILAGQDERGLAGLKARFPGGVFFHYNFWCNVDDPLQQSFCRKILEKFPHTEVTRFAERTYVYTLYRLE